MKHIEGPHMQGQSAGEMSSSNANEREPSGNGRPGDMGRVALVGVTKAFGGVVAVDQLDLQIDDEEFLVLLGPSGCGKSTALRMILSLTCSQSARRGLLRSRPIRAAIIGDLTRRISSSNFVPTNFCA